MPPDLRTFDQHAKQPTFLAGVYRENWAIESVAWPRVDISVAAAERKGAPARFWLHCDFSNYPADAPTATPWDPDTGTTLGSDKRPKGEYVGVVFRDDWEAGLALYAAYDRVALAGHQNWLSEHPRTTWNGTQDLTWWVQRIWELLNNDDYLGV